MTDNQISQYTVQLSKFSTGAGLYACKARYGLNQCKEAVQQLRWGYTILTVLENNYTGNGTLTSTNIDCLLGVLAGITTALGGYDVSTNYRLINTSGDRRLYSTGNLRKWQ